MPEPPALRSYLYAPGSNPRILAKVLDAGADAVVLDLEDAVAPADKATARAAVARLVAERGAGAPCQVHVRVNRDLREDLRAVVVPGLAGVRLPKVESAADVRAADELLSELEGRAGVAAGSVALYPTVETAVGVLAARELAGASPRVARLGFGALDFMADLGLPGSVGGPAANDARSRLVLASRAAGVGAPADGVYPGLDDPEGLRRACASARDLGCFGKSALHPRQLAAIHQVFTPSAEEVGYAERLLQAIGGNATGMVDGQFVDAPVVARARALLALAARLG